MQAQFDSLKTFDFAQSTVHLWVYKKSTAARKYNAFYVQTDPALSARFKDIFRSEMARIIEFSAYGHLTETNEVSCLAIDVAETEFQPLKLQVDRPEPDCRARSVNDLKGADGYLVKFTHNGSTVYAVRRSVGNWKTAFSKKYLNVIFSNGELSAAEDNGFTIEKNFDFFVKDKTVFVANKRGFESTLQYRAAYNNAFSSLQQDLNFAPLFQNIQPLVTYVGTNSMHLRRMTEVVKKGIFARPNFLQNLQRVNLMRNWGINFDPATNRIVVCEQTAKTIVDVLLDHRLMSEVTANSYLVPDATLQP